MLKQAPLLENDSPKHQRDFDIHTDNVIRPEDQTL